MPGRNLKLLCLDGGGVRGLSSLYILQRLMESIDSERPPKPCEYFDMIGGTSTGGLIAIMLGRLEMDVDSCIKSYLHMCNTIFSDKKLFAVNLTGNIRARFKAAPLEKAIKQVITDQGFAADELLKKPENRCKVFVCATSSNVSTPILFTSYPIHRGTSSLYHQTKIWEAARATSAAPTFFSPIQIGSTRRTFGDGAMGACNPIHELWNEAIELCNGEPLHQNLACLISIGTGVPNLRKFGKNVIEVVDSITRIATQTQITANNFNRSHPELSVGHQRYFRFNTTGGLAEIELDEASEAGTIEAMTDVYLRDENVVKQVRECAKILADNNLVLFSPVATPASSSLGLRMTDRPEWRVILSEHSISGSDLFQRISSYSYQREYGRRARRKLENTTEWISKEPCFESWLREGQPRCLWLTGIIGCGKSTTLTTVIDQAFIEAQKTGRPVLHYFFNHSFRRYLTARSLFESYVKQLLYYLESIKKGCPPMIMDRIVDFYGPKSQLPSLEEVVEEIFKPLLATARNTTLIVDGLDECSPSEIQKIVTVFKSLLTTSSSRIFISSREELDITRKIPSSSRIRVTPENTKADMEHFIDHKIEQMQSHHRISENEDMLTYIKDDLKKKADRMFLWAELQIDLLWKNCSGIDAVDETIYQSLQQLSDDLNDLYQACQQRVFQDERRRSLATKALKLMCAAVEPFQVSQLQEALVVDPKTGELKSGAIQKDELVACCASFVYLENNGKHELILLAHYSVRQFLLASLQIDCDAAQLQLGELCVVHLHKYMPLRDLVHHRAESSTGPRQIYTSIPIGISSAITNILAPRLFRSPPSRSGHSVAIRLSAPAPRISVTFDGKTFLCYAKEHWTSLTQSIPLNSFSYSKFETVALFNSKLWWIYPWRRNFDSNGSHVHAMYGWSIMNRHYGLLALAIGQKTRVNKSVYSLPLHSSIGGGSLVPFEAAAKIGDIKVAQLLLEILPRENRHFERALRIICTDGHEAMLRLLLSYRVNVNAREAGQQSPLHIAVQLSHKPIRRLLYEAGASPNLVTLEGQIAMVFSPNGKLLVSGSSEGLTIYTISSGTVLKTWQEPDNKLFTVVFSPDGRLLASPSKKTVMLWDVSSGVPLLRLEGHSNAVRTVVFSPDSKQLASISRDKTVILWDTTSGAALVKFGSCWEEFTAVVFSPDGNLLASALDDNTVRLWNSSLGTTLRTLEGHLGTINTAVFSPDGKLLASASSDHTIILWDVSSGVALQTLNGSGGLITAVVFSPDGKLLASCSSMLITLWDVLSGAALQMLGPSAQGYSSTTLAFSPNGRLLAVASDRIIERWDTSSEAVLQTLSGHFDSVYALVFSPDNKLLASASYDGSVKLWDAG